MKVFAAASLCSALLFGQKPEYEFYSDYYRDRLNPLPCGRGSSSIHASATSRDRKGVPMGFRPTKGDEGPLADARGSAWDAHCKQSRDRKGALEVWTFNGSDFQRNRFKRSRYYRTFLSSLWIANPSITPEAILARYTAKLKRERGADEEIARRSHLLKTDRAKLEADRWERYYKDSNNNEKFNQGPNEFLAAFVAGRPPGTVLDYAMGTGRNALYLAKLGWDVYGFDHSAIAVAEAQARARNLASPSTRWLFRTASTTSVKSALT